MASVFFLSELTKDELIQVKAHVQHQHTNARADAQMSVEPVEKRKLLRLVEVLEAKLARIYAEFERRASANATQSLYPW